jgi:pyrimidine operon attenuation protein / uracil phosphoribosyltransferase
MSATEIERTLLRLAHEIVERNNGTEGLALVGIRRRGAFLAERLAARVGEIEKFTPPVGGLDITAYRDDLSLRALPASPVPSASPAALPDNPQRTQPSSLPFSIEDRIVLLVDDVLYTGRTTRAALDALVDAGRPQRVELAVLVDRGHRELPIQANYVGRTVETTSSETVEVRLREVDGEERVLLCEADG